MSRALLWSLPFLLAAVVFLAIGVTRGRTQAAILRADPETILGNPVLRAMAVKQGKAVFDGQCASCHGPEGKGDEGLGIPNLTDDDHLYGTGTVAQIEDIARYGIRSHNKHGFNLASMPAYASRNPYSGEKLPPQTPAAINELTQYLLTFTARQTDAAAAKRGLDDYTKAGCWDCHGRDLGGDPAIGAPNLTDDIWLYGGRPDDIRRSISRGRAGVSPAFARVLSAPQMRNVAVYVASLAPSPQDRK